MPPRPQTYFALAVLVILPLSVTLASKHYVEDRLADANGELDKLKSLDRLTGVPNRKRFDLVLDREWQRATRDPKHVALLMVDVDDFDLFNQHYGPQAGDECLRLIADSDGQTSPTAQYDLRFTVSKADKFSVLLPGASGDAVKRIGEEFRAEIAAQSTGRMSGASIWPRDGLCGLGRRCFLTPKAPSLTQLIAAAEAALRVGKKERQEQGRGLRQRTWLR